MLVHRIEGYRSMFRSRICVIYDLGEGIILQVNEFVLETSPTYLNSLVPFMHLAEDRHCESKPSGQEHNANAHYITPLYAYR